MIKLKSAQISSFYRFIFRTVGVTIGLSPIYSLSLGGKNVMTKIKFGTLKSGEIVSLFYWRFHCIKLRHTF